MTRSKLPHVSLSRARLTAPGPAQPLATSSRRGRTAKTAARRAPHSHCDSVLLAAVPIAEDSPPCLSNAARKSRSRAPPAYVVPLPPLHLAPTRREKHTDACTQIVRTLVQSVGIFLLIQFATKQFFGQTPAPGTPDPAKPGAVVPNAKVSIPAFDDRPTTFHDGAIRSVIPQNVAPMWPVGTEVDISMYISPSIAMPPLKQLPKDALLIDEKAFKFGNYNENRVVETEFRVPPAVQHNATLFAHFYVAQAGSQLDPTRPDYDKTKAYHMIRPLTQYQPKKKISKTRNLLSDLPDTVESEEEKNTPKVIGNYYHSNFSISMIPDSGVVNFPAMHAGVREFFQLDQTGSRDATGQNGWYYPVLFTNTFWQLKKDMIELNDTVRLFPLDKKTC